MIALKDKVNVNAPNGTWPYGELRDNPGDNSGTPVDEVLVSDVMQLMEYIMNDGGVVPTGLLDNLANGFQLADALTLFIRSKQATESDKGTAEIATNAEVITGTDTERMVVPSALTAWFNNKFGAWFNSTPTTTGEVNIGTITNQNFHWHIKGKEVSCKYFYNFTTLAGGATSIQWELNSISTPILGIAPICTSGLQGSIAGAYTRNGVCRIGNGSDFTKMVHVIDNVAGAETIQVTGTITFEIA
jgi:hypothetical protein